jgi:hypothetical protein
LRLFQNGERQNGRAGGEIVNAFFHGSRYPRRRSETETEAAAFRRRLARTRPGAERNRRLPGAFVFILVFYSTRFSKARQGGRARFFFLISL